MLPPNDFTVWLQLYTALIPFHHPFLLPKEGVLYFSGLDVLTERYIIVRFKVLMVESMKMAVFWVVALCSLVVVYLHFRGEMLVNFYQTIQNNPQDSHLQYILGR
jgi:hypothetical protein